MTAKHLLGETLDITMILNAKQVKGTPKYMSPEQVLGVSEVDYRSDIFSMGLILYEMLSGSHPFEGKNAREIMHAIKSEPIPPIKSMFISKNVIKVCMKALEKLPQKRYQDVRTMTDDISNVLALKQVSVHKDNPVLRFSKFIRRNLLISLITLSVAAVGFLVYSE